MVRTGDDWRLRSKVGGGGGGALLEHEIWNGGGSQGVGVKADVSQMSGLSMRGFGM